MKNETEFDLKAEGRPISVLNLYAGIGGNRKLWPENVKVTAVEYNEEIAGIYKDYFPNDEVIVDDAHQVLLDTYSKYDMIWSSPPCQSHSDIRRMGVTMGQNEPLFPDMKLWQEIVFLKHHFNGKYVVENVVPYYEPFIKPTKQLDRHFLWSNFKIPHKDFKKNNQIKSISSNTNHYGFNISRYKISHRKDQILRNCVNPELGLHVFQCAVGAFKSNSIHQHSLWNT